MNWIEQKTLGLFVKTNGIISEPILGGIGHIFMLHRILPNPLNTYETNKSLAISPSHLEECIQYFISKKYVFISLDELTSILKGKEKRKEKFICFTLDDGYKDNLVYGFPVFKKYNIPFTIYITNCFPNNTAILWWYLLEKKMKEKSSLELNTIVGFKKYTWQNEKERNSVYNEIRDEIRKIPATRFRKSVLDMLAMNEEEVMDENKNLFLNWDEIRQISQEEIGCIGAHTVNHLSLKSLTDNELENEIISSKEEIEIQIKQKVNHFAYPYGGREDVGKRECELVKKLGFKTGTLNQAGNVFMKSRIQMECLPRMPLGNATTRKQMDYILNGINHFSYNRFNKLHY